MAARVVAGKGGCDVCTGCCFGNVGVVDGCVWGVYVGYLVG